LSIYAYCFNYSQFFLFTTLSCRNWSPDYSVLVSLNKASNERVGGSLISHPTPLFRPMTTTNSRHEETDLLTTRDTENPAMLKAYKVKKIQALCCTIPVYMNMTSTGLIHCCLLMSFETSPCVAPTQHPFSEVLLEEHGAALLRPFQHVSHRPRNVLHLQHGQGRRAL
jgi:hypothetical protein